MQVIYEPLIDAHAPTLYRAARTEAPLRGWDAVGPAELAQYENDGFLVIGGALTTNEVAAARDELRDMTLADDPRCSIMHYEGALRRRLPRVPAAQKAGGLA